MENQIMREFLQSVNHLRKAAHQLRPSFKIAMGEFKMLGIIHEHTVCKAKKQPSGPGIKVSELSVLTHSTRPATTKMLNSLEAKGYIERVMDTKDRRVVYIRLSENGHAVIKDALDMMYTLGDKVIAKMGNEDSGELIRLLNKLSQIVSDELQQYRKE